MTNELGAQNKNSQLQKQLESLDKVLIQEKDISINYPGLSASVWM